MDYPRQFSRKGHGIPTHSTRTRTQTFVSWYARSVCRWTATEWSVSTYHSAHNNLRYPNMTCTPRIQTTSTAGRNCPYPDGKVVCPHATVKIGLGAIQAHTGMYVLRNLGICAIHGMHIVQMIVQSLGSALDSPWNMHSKLEFKTPNPTLHSAQSMCCTNS